MAKVKKLADETLLRMDPSWQRTTNDIRLERERAVREVLLESLPRPLAEEGRGFEPLTLHDCIAAFSDLALSEVLRCKQSNPTVFVYEDGSMDAAGQRLTLDAVALEIARATGLWQAENPRDASEAALAVPSWIFRALRHQPRLLPDFGLSLEQSEGADSLALRPLERGEYLDKLEERWLEAELEEQCQ